MPTNTITRHASDPCLRLGAVPIKTIGHRADRCLQLEEVPTNTIRRHSFDLCSTNGVPASTMTRMQLGVSGIIQAVRRIAKLGRDDRREHRTKSTGPQK